MKIAIIPARAGSKRIPKKNIKPFLNVPIINRTLQKLKKYNFFDKIYISTDDDEIIDTVQKQFSNVVCIKRPQHLADDYATTRDVIAHVIENNLNLDNLDIIYCIYPCALFIEKHDLKHAFDLLHKNDFKFFIYPVTEFPHPIQRALMLDKRDRIKFINKDNESKRTQDLDTYFHDTGQFYVATSSLWLNSKNLHSDSIGLKIPNFRVFDIDTVDDWNRAEQYYRILENQKKMESMKLKNYYC